MNTPILSEPVFKIRQKTGEELAAMSTPRLQWWAYPEIRAINRVWYEPIGDEE